MTNLYSAEYVDFNWVFFYLFACVGAIGSFYFYRVKKSLFNRKAISIGAFCLFLFFAFVFSSNKGFYTNRVLLEARVLYEGEVSKVEYGSGFEVVKIAEVFLPRAKYKYSGYPSQCWKDDFEKILTSDQIQKFKIEVYWIKGEQRHLEYSKKYTNDFPCILKVDLVKE
jgi:hypothetical protein